MTLTSLVAVQSNIHPGPNLPGQVTITEDTYTHWIEAAGRGDVLEVDRLSRVPGGEAVTQAVTPMGATV